MRGRIAGVLVVVAACGGDKAKPKPDATPAPPPACTLNLSGTLTADQTVKQGCTATVTDSVVVKGATLTIEGGATVAFLDGRSLSVGTDGPGKLVITGTAATPAKLVLAAGMQGAWGQVHLGAGAAGSSVVGASIAHAGKDGASALLVEAPDVTVTGTTVGDVAGVGIELAPTLTFAAFSGNHLGATGPEQMRMGPEAVGAIGDGNTFTKERTIAVVPGTLTRSLTWRALGAPYSINDILKIEMAGTRATLTLDAGVEVRFTTKAGFAVGMKHPGGLRLAGRADAPVTLTSVDGKPSAWTLWVGKQGEVVIESGVIAAGGLDHDTGAIAVRGGSLEVYRTTFRDDVVGLSVDADAKVAVDGCTFLNNSLFAIALHTQLGALGNNTYDVGSKIELRGGTVSGAVTWKPQTQVWWDGPVTVDGTLTIEAGVEMTMMSAKALLKVGRAAAAKPKKGKKPPKPKTKLGLVIHGAPGNPVKLAGVRASPGTWGNIVLAGDQDSSLEEVVISGSGGNAAISIGDGARVQIKNVSCEQCAGAVVAHTCGAQVTLDGIKAGAGTPVATLAPQCQTVSVPVKP